MPSPFLEPLRNDMRLRGCSIKTEKSYMEWIKRYICLIGKKHPDSAGANKVGAFLTHLAVERKVAVNTQKVALNVVAFPYHKHLRRELGDLCFSLATKQRYMPSVFSKESRIPSREA